MSKRFILTLSLVSLPAPASSAEPVYFHKADVDRETFVAEFGECNELAGGVRVAPMKVYSPNMVSMAASSFFAPFFQSSMKRGLTNNVLRTCMMDKGYRRVEVSDGEEKALTALTAEARVDRLFALAAAPEAQGKVLPR